MGTGWRRAFCTTTARDRELKFVDKHLLQDQEPRLRCRTTSASSNDDNNNDDVFTPNLHCRTTTPKSNSSKTPRFSQPSNPASPRSPFSILKNTLRLSKHSCGICMHSVKTGQGMAIYTAECSHSFHFPCIVSHSRKQSTLFCPVCNRVWKDVPLLSGHLFSQQEEMGFERKQEQVEEKKIIREKTEPEKLRNMKQQGIGLKTYDDDEPLHLPASVSGKFTAIPEVNEMEEVEEVEEFQGFFVNPVSSDEAPANHKETRNVDVTILPEAAIVSAGETHVTYAVVLKVKAPPPQPPAGYGSSGSRHISDPARRAPIDLVTLLDVSGSMNGPKLQMLKRAMRLVISSLGSADRLSIVAFAATAKRLLPLRRMTAQGQKSARKIVDQLVCSQGTCVGEALRKAAKVLEDRREKNPVASIMLLSDGQDDRVQKTGEPDGRRETPQRSSTRFSHIEIPVSSSGFGKKAGYSHAPNADAFSKCVGGLLSVVAQDLRIQLGFTSSPEPADVVTVYSSHGRPAVQDPSSVRLGDLYADEERELLVEVRVPSAAVGSHHVLSLRCCHIDPATQDLVNAREQSLLLPRPQAVGSSSSPEIQRLRNFFVATRAMLVQNGSCYEYVRGLDGELTEAQFRKHHQPVKKAGIQRRRAAEFTDEDGEPLTPTSAWRAAEKLAKVAMKKKPASRVSELHGFENARF